MEANVLGYVCFHRVGEAGVSSWAGGGGRSGGKPLEGLSLEQLW